MKKLQGTEKQILWANKIREDFLSEFIELKNIEKFRNTEIIDGMGRVYTKEEQKKSVEKVEEIKNLLLDIEESKWFIDNRYIVRKDEFFRKLTEILKIKYSTRLMNTYFVLRRKIEEL